MALVPFVPKILATAGTGGKIAIWQHAGKIEGIDYTVNPTGDPVLIAQRVAPTDAQIAAAVADLRSTGILHAVDNFDKENEALRDPKGYIMKYNDRLRKAMGLSAVEAIGKRNQLKNAGAPDTAADSMAREFYQDSLAAHSAVINYEFPSDLVNSIRATIEKNRIITDG